LAGVRKCAVDNIAVTGLHTAATELTPTADTNMIGTGYALLDGQKLDLALYMSESPGGRIHTGPKGMAVGCKTVGSASSLNTLPGTARSSINDQSWQRP